LLTVNRSTLLRNDDDASRLLTVAEVASRFNVTERTIWNDIRRRVLPAQRLRGRTLIAPEDLNNYRSNSCKGRNVQSLEDLLASGVIFSERIVRQWVATGELASAKIGNRRFVFMDEPCAPLARALEREGISTFGQWQRELAIYRRWQKKYFRKLARPSPMIRSVPPKESTDSNIQESSDAIAPRAGQVMQDQPRNLRAPTVSRICERRVGVGN